MAEQFCLRWNNHQSTLVSVFEKLLEQETHIDCTLWAEGRVLRAHKVVLSACSPTFESMLCVQEDKHPIIFLKDVKYVELKAMLDYMYRGEVNISQDQLDSFLKTAEALQVKGLTDQGGGTDEPPAKKGPGRKTGMSDVAPESPLVGNAPLREGSTSPGPGGKRRRRLPRRHSGEESESNDCDSLQAPAAPPQAVCPPADSAARLAPPVHHPSPAPPPPATIVKKEVTQELVTPKTEYVEENTGDIEDLTLDDDDDYGEMSKPGTSFGMAQGSTSQDFSQWQQMTDDRTRDEVFMAAQEAINNQSNAQGPGKQEKSTKAADVLAKMKDVVITKVISTDVKTSEDVPQKETSKPSKPDVSDKKSNPILTSSPKSIVCARKRKIGERNELEPKISSTPTKTPVKSAPPAKTQPVEDISSLLGFEKAEVIDVPKAKEKTEPKPLMISTQGLKKPTLENIFSLLGVEQVEVVDVPKATKSKSDANKTNSAKSAAKPKAPSMQNFIGFLGMEKVEVIDVPKVSRTKPSKNKVVLSEAKQTKSVKNSSMGSVLGILGLQKIDVVDAPRVVARYSDASKSVSTETKSPVKKTGLAKNPKNSSVENMFTLLGMEKAEVVSSPKVIKVISEPTKEKARPKVLSKSHIIKLKPGANK